MSMVYFYVVCLSVCFIVLVVEISKVLSSKCIRVKGLITSARIVTENEITQYDSHYNIICQVEYTFEGVKYHCEIPVSRTRLPKQNEAIDIMFDTQNRAIIGKTDFQIGRIFGLVFIAIFLAYLLYSD